MIILPSNIDAGDNKQTLFENVQRGIAWLDENVPNWVSRIDLTIFNMRSAYACVLGQLFDGYGNESGFGYALEIHFCAPDVSSDDYGFSAPIDSLRPKQPDDTYDDQIWAFLDGLWYSAIAIRQADERTIDLTREAHEILAAHLPSDDSLKD